MACASLHVPVLEILCRTHHDRWYSECDQEDSSSRTEPCFTLRLLLLAQRQNPSGIQLPERGEASAGREAGKPVNRQLYGEKGQF